MPGDADDWTTWLAEHGPALVLLARQYVGSRADAEDVVQEAFIRFWRVRTTVDAPAAYVFACVRHAAFDWRRGQRRRSDRDAAAARPESAQLLMGPLQDTERREAIESALRTLPEQQAEVLVMKIWGGLTFPQIGAALDISANTAASRYRYSLDKLREQLAEEPTR